MIFNDFMSSAHDMTSFIVEAQWALEELKMFLEVDNLEEIKKLDMFYMVMILRVMYLYLDDLRDHTLSCQEIPLMESQ